MKLKLIKTIFIVINLCVLFHLSAAADDQELNDPALYNFYTVTNTYFKFDPYEGQYIDEYWFFFNNKMVWKFNWHLYKSNDLAIKVGDFVKINYGTESSPEYEMVLYSSDLKPMAKIIGFQGNKTTIRAIEVNKFQDRTLR